MSADVSPAPVVQTDRFASARLVADTVLYEGYVLYPYRASAQKNQLRWQFGVLAPPDYARSSGSERSSMCSEVIVDPRDRPRLTVRIRCLQIQHRDVEATTDCGTAFAPVDSLSIDGTTIVPWDEALDREVDLDVVNLLPVVTAIHEHTSNCLRVPTSRSSATIAATSSVAPSGRVRKCAASFASPRSSAAIKAAPTKVADC